ncbi:hypothetical protein G7Z17_g9329 [Cylindrodendrum hubeiense]|uniref:Extracellular serine-rich protein n=1 Tax=Cylindrodendrum hubeiense TaxID=595255 RepID=A0A9P5L5S3_9HYPO|nr:hypothetical protein G7Z17_g9329 [Cylindrodendrum hubeiense]
MAAAVNTAAVDTTAVRVADPASGFGVGLAGKAISCYARLFPRLAANAIVSGLASPSMGACSHMGPTNAMRVLNVAVAALGALSQLADAKHIHPPRHLRARDDNSTTLADNPDNILNNAGFSDGLDNFNHTGNVKVVAAPGPDPDASDDQNYVVELVATGESTSRVVKRASLIATISSFLTDLFAKHTYTVQFQYAVVSSNLANSCRIQAYMGLTLVGSTPYFPVVASGSTLKWLSFSAPVTVTGSSSTVLTSVVCGRGGTAKVQMNAISVVEGLVTTTSTSITSTTTTSTTSKSTTAAVTTTSSVVVAVVSSSTSSAVSSSSSASSTTLSSVVSSSTSSAVSSSTTVSSSSTLSSTSTSASASASAHAANVDSTILIIAADDYGASTASLGLLAYGIPYENLIVPKAGVALPVLNTSTTAGRYGGIIVISSVAYDYGTAWNSALTDDQWNALYAYQTDFRIRMVRINDFPGPKFGTAAVGAGCCDTGVEQLVSISDTTDFPTANIKTGAGLSTTGLYHVPASVTDTNTTHAVATFGIATGFASESVAAVINNFSGREQFVWFMSWAPDWSQTCAFLQHAHIHWLTRGVFLGKRKVHLSPQIDDVQLSTTLYSPANVDFKIRTGDLDAHVTWQTDINTRLPAGSDFRLEMAHNGNGDLIAATALTSAVNLCIPNYAVDYDSPNDTALEYQKPLGTGVNLWPSEWTTYKWTKTCAVLDDFASWFLVTKNLNQFSHVSHTFSHMELNNATYSDANREIQFNQAWLSQMGIDKATRFSAHGLIPPAITGLHNGDAIKGWIDNGITHVVGDNTRPLLRNQNNKYWPLISTVAANGYDGLVIIPRFATTIYYNCDTAACTTLEWINTSAGSGTFTNLLAQAKTDNTRYLLSLMADPYMFHQANLRQIDVDTITIGTKTGKMSLVMAWTETIVQEMTRLTNWPILSLKHDDFTQYFLDRKSADDCNPTLSYGFSSSGAIESVTVSTTGNTCSVPIPVTIPSGTVTASSGSVKVDQLGSEPPIQWVTLSGSPVTLSLSKAVST